MAESISFTSERLLNRNINFLSGPKFIGSDSFAVSLRKSKRNSIIANKRKIFMENNLDSNAFKGIHYSTIISRENLTYLSTLLISYNNENELYLALRTLKFIYTLNNNDLAFKITISLNIINSISSLINDLNIPIDCLKEATLCLCNLTAGPSFIVNALISKDIIFTCKKLLNHHDQEIIENSVWCLSNIASDNRENRKKILELGILEYLISKFVDFQYMLSTLLFALRNLLEGGLVIKENLIKELLKIARITIKTKNDNIIENSLWIVSNISDGSLNCVQILLDNKIIGRIIKLADSNSAKICFPAIRTLGNIAAGTCEQVQIILDKELLDVLYSQLYKIHSNKIKRYIL